jgi:CHC2 zinc finger
MPFIDFASVKERVSIEDAAALLGLALHKSGNQLRGPCHVCKTGGERALAITPAKSLFYCFAAQSGGDQIQLVAHMKGCKLTDAAEFLAGTSTVTSTSTVPNGTVSKKQATAPQAPPQQGFKALDYLEPGHDAVVAAGLDEDTCRFIGAGYAGKGVLRGTVAIPIRDETGTLLGYIGVQEVLLPPKGLLPQTNVVPLKQRA